MDEDNKVVLVTRPEQQAAEFIGLLEAKGIKALSFPCIDIQQVKLDKLLKETLNTLDENYLLIFISVNAVEQAYKMMRQQGIEPSSIDAKVATIGKATLKAANLAGFDVSISPKNGFNTESLLRLKELQSNYINGTKCLIVRGVGGLEQLADELRQRGADVSYAEVYQRGIPHHDANISRQQLSRNWQSMGIAVITVTSNESLQNLYDMLELPGKEAMLGTRLIVASQRCFELAQKLGFKSIKLALSAMNQQMLEAVENEFQ